jgi:putative membrane protein
MNRRTALATLTGAAGASLLIPRATPAAWAQTTPPGQGATLGDGAHTKRTLMVGTLSKEMSLLAPAHAADPRVKQFAEFEVAEQTAMAQVLTNLNSPPPAPLDQHADMILGQLRQSEGKAFDSAYIKGEIAGHQRLLSIQQDFLNGVPTDHDHEHIAVLARMVIQMHLVMLDDLHRALAA